MLHEVLPKCNVYKQRPPYCIPYCCRLWLFNPQDGAYSKIHQLVSLVINVVHSLFNYTTTLINDLLNIEISLAIIFLNINHDFIPHASQSVTI